MVDFKRLAVIPLRLKGKEIGNSPWWPLQGNLSGSSTDPCLLLFLHSFFLTAPGSLRGVGTFQHRRQQSPAAVTGQGV